MARKSKKVKQQVVIMQSSQKKSGRSARRRRARLARRGKLGPVRYPGGKLPRTKDGANFVRGALDPFSDISLRSVGVPDTFAGDTLKHVNTMEVTVIPDSNGQIEFTLVPSPSNPLLMKYGTYQNVLLPTSDDSGVPTGTIVRNYDASAHTAGSYSSRLAALAWPSWATYYGNDIPAAAGVSGAYGPYDYKSQRIVSQGLEWRYTGTTLSDQGICTAAILDAYILPGYYEKGSSNPNAITTSSTKFLVRGDLTNLNASDESQLSNQPKFVQQTMHTSEGAGGMSVMISSEEGYTMLPTAPGSIILNATDTSADLTANRTGACLGTAGFSSVTPANEVTFPILPWQNLRPIGFSFTGLPTSGSSIVLRLKQRIEATVNVYSTFQQFTDKSPSEDPESLCIVADIQKGIPVMVPVTMNGFGDWWRKIMGVISSAGKIVGGLGLPVVSQVAAGVGGMADILGSFADI